MKLLFIVGLACAAAGACSKPKSPPAPTPQVIAAGDAAGVSGTRSGNPLLTAVDGRQCPFALTAADQADVKKNPQWRQA